MKYTIAKTTHPKVFKLAGISEDTRDKVLGSVTTADYMVGRFEEQLLRLIESAPDMRDLLQRCRKDGVLPQKLEIEIDRLLKTLK